MPRELLTTFGRACFLAAVGVFLGCATGEAQTHTATVRGTVHDASGGVIKNAAVSLVNVDQQRAWGTRTGGTGEYVLVQIPPGNYELSVESPGFSKYRRQGLVLQVAQTVELDVSLEVGAVTETIDVRAPTPLIEPGSSSLGEVVNARFAEAMPLSTRDINQLVALTPGISDSPSFRRPKFSSGNVSNFSSNGGPGATNEIILDGSPQTMLGTNQAAYVPQPEAVQEFNVQTNGLSAEYGRTGGAVVNIVHRSGTREFHGELYEFLRNDKLNANAFFDNRNGRSRGPFRGNDFGVALGGPLTPARNSTFFFVNVQRILVAAPISQTLTVPTARMKNGDFGEPGVGAVYDPGTIDAAGARRPFPGNQIPAALWNPIGVSLLKFYPTPTSPGIGNNLFARAGEYPSATDVSVKIDRRISERQNLSGRFSTERFTDQRPNFFGNAASPDEGATDVSSQSATLDDSYSRGRWILHGNYGYAYCGVLTLPAAPGFDPVSLGFPVSMRSGLQVANVPTITLNGEAGLGPNNYPAGNTKLENHALSLDAVWAQGRHTLKFGGTYRVNRGSLFQSNSPSGSFTFAEGFTRPSFNSSGGGNAVASLLLGLPTAGAVGYEPALAIQVRYAGLFLQDDWRISRRLTLNLGLRWDTDRPLTERFDRTSWFDPGARLPLTVAGLGQVRGGLVFAGQNGGPRGNKDPDDNNFGPRAGFAYSVTSHFVLRSGFGIMYVASLDNGPTASNIGALGFNASTPYISDIDGGRTPFTTLSNPFPGGFNLPANGSDGLRTFLGAATTNGQFRRDRTPYVAQWHFNTQYELRGETLIDIGYAGSAGVKLPAQVQLNQLPDPYLALGDGLKKIVPNPFFGIIPVTSKIGQSTTTAGQLLRPYPQFDKVVQTWGSLAHSSYHALQAKFRKRYRGGLQMLAAYTWSKMLDDNSGPFNGGNQGPAFTNNNRRDLDKGYSAFDIPHRFVGSFEYELPFGVGRRLLNAKGIVNGVAGGWHVSGIVTFASGAPISVGAAQNNTGAFDGNARPNRTGISSRTPGSPGERIDSYLNPAAFTSPANYVFGNAGRFLPENRGPGRQNLDVTIGKSFPFRERIHLDFRAEAFNLLNHANFLGPYPPATVFGQPTFGTITTTDGARSMQLALKLNF